MVLINCLHAIYCILHLQFHMFFTPSSALPMKIPCIMVNSTPPNLGNSLVHLSKKYSLKLDTLGLVPGMSSTFMPLGQVDMVFYLLIFVPILSWANLCVFPSKIIQVFPRRWWSFCVIACYQPTHLNSSLAYLQPIPCSVLTKEI